jgi:uncharacterized Ntn-hydrolase superfamily protein
MTFSIVARCAKTGQFGVGAVTGVPAVGKLLTHAAGGVGAVATQAKLNPYLGIDGLQMLRDGLTAAEVRDRLVGSDPAIERRQFAVIDRTGATAVHTGKQCLKWAGALQRDGYSIQGNRLAGEAVLTQAAEAFERGSDEPLSNRLMNALAAGDAAGGDLKGEVSATIYIMAGEEYPLWDIRVDHHPDPIAELRRLHGVFSRELLPEICRMPTRANPGGEPGEHSV